MHAVASGIFEIIVDQSPYAIEDLMKELESSGDEEDMSEDDEQGKKEMLKTKGEDRVMSILSNNKILKFYCLKIRFCPEPLKHVFRVVWKRLSVSSFPFGCA